MDDRTPVKLKITEDEFPPYHVRSNLLSAFNDCEHRYASQSSFTPNEVIRLQTERLKAHYHLQPHPFSDNDGPENTEFICELDTSKPSLRKQLQEYVARKNSMGILKSFKDMRRLFVRTLPPYNYSRLSIPFSDSFKIYQMTSGTYIHFGIKKKLRLLQDHATDRISINIGMYVGHITKKDVSIPKYLTIYGKQLTENHTFMIGVYCGQFPVEIIANEILQPLVAEIRHVQDNGIDLNDRLLQFEVSCIICDPIATSLVTCTTWPESMYGCSKCKMDTCFIPLTGKTSFSTTVTDADLRDDEDFKFCVVTEHHLATPVLAELGVGLISQVSVDYKHIVCLGIMKTLIQLWSCGSVEIRFNMKTLVEIDDALVELSSSCPSEFRTKPKLITQYEKWSAFDFRQFLLYFGPVALRGRVPQDIYVNFLCLNLAMRVALDPKNNTGVNYCIFSQLAQVFVKDYARLYGHDRVDYDIHNLLHLERMLRKYQCLEKVGGFLFEPCVDEADVILKSTLSSPGWSFETLAKLIVDQQSADNDNSEIPTDGMIISNSEPDNYFVLPEGIVRLECIAREVSGGFALYGRRFHETMALTDISTTNQNILLVTELGNLEKIDASAIIYKAVVFNSNEQIFAMPLLTF